MTDRVFVQVVGFSDEERHALNTWFRMSQQHDGGYVVWDAAAPVPAALALLDGDSYAARFEIESPRVDKNLKVIWIGQGAPAGVWRNFARPLNWPTIVAAADAQFGFQSPPVAVPDMDIDLDFEDFEDTGANAAANTDHGGLDLDLDLDLDLNLGQESGQEIGQDKGQDATPSEWASDTQPAGDEPPIKRALVIAPSLDDRLYLRARLALAGLTQMDEAPDAATGLAQAREQKYALVVIDLDLPQQAGWQALARLRSVQPPIAHLVAVSSRRGWWGRFQAHRAGASACLLRPLDPRKVFELLRKL